MQSLKKGAGMLPACGLVAAIILFGGLRATQAAMTLTLSDCSSDETPAQDLDATMAFSVLGNSLTLTVTNDTSAPSPYYISEIYFNATSNVAGLTLDDPTGGWDLGFTEDAAVGDGFGAFDAALLADAREDQIGPGSSLTFTITIADVGPFAASDFTTEASVVPPGDAPSLAAAKFVRGPGDDSAFGNAIPEPATLAFLGLGGVVALLRRRSK